MLLFLKRYEPLCITDLCYMEYNHLQRGTTECEVIRITYSVEART